MANELLYGSGGASNLYDSSRVAAMFIQTLGHRDTSVLAHPAFGFMGDVSGTMTDTHAIPVVDMWSDQWTSLTEIQEMSPTDISSAVPTITVGRYGLMRDPSDKARSLDGTGALNEVALVDGMITGMNLTTLQLLANLVDDFSTVKGASGATMTHATVRSAKQALRLAGVQGPYVALMHPTQINEWETDFQSLGGAIQYRSEDQRALSRLTGGSFIGTVDNIDFYQSDLVNDDSTDFKGGMWGRDTIGWKVMTQAPLLSNDRVVVNLGWIRVVVQATPTKALESLVGNAWIGMSELQDSGGVTLRSGS